LGTHTPLIPNENGEIEIALPYLEENDQLPVIDVDSDTGVCVCLFIDLKFFLKKNRS
jgi:hypothetical protein